MTNAISHSAVKSRTERFVRRERESKSNAIDHTSKYEHEQKYICNDVATMKWKYCKDLGRVERVSWGIGFIRRYEGGQIET